MQLSSVKPVDEVDGVSAELFSTVEVSECENIRDILHAQIHT